MPVGTAMMETGFGELLRRYRLAANLTQEELAERAGVSTRGISDLERGARGLPRKDTLQLLLQALDLSPNDRAELTAAARRQPASSKPRERHEGAPTLPMPLTRLIGREAEITAIIELLNDPEARLLTLTGAGGTGKTRLALAVAERLQAAYADGAVFVDLAPLRDPFHVLPTVAAVLGLSEAPGLQLSGVTRRYLASRRLLLVLDNFEHLLEAAPGVLEILTAGSRVTVLVTSREPLLVRIERVFPVLPLPLPDLQRHVDPEQLARVPSVALFIERAKAGDPGFAPSDENAAALATICRRLDGLPLAIELAASRARFLPPTALAARLERVLPVLTSGPRDAPARQRTLRDTIAWSHDLLPANDQALMRRLSVFAGGWTLEAAEAVANPDSHLDVFEGLATLVDRSLVRRLDDGHSEPRFGMLETIREFGVEQLTLTETEEEEASRQRHAEYFAGLAEQAAPHFFAPGERDWLDRCEAEVANITTALTWSAAHDREPGLRIAGSLWWYWHTRGGLSRGRNEIEPLLVRAGGAPSLLVARAKRTLGMLATFQPDYPTARTALAESHDLFVQIGEDQAAAQTLLCRGILELHARGADESAEQLQTGLALLRAHGDRTWEGIALFFLGVSAAFVQPVPDVGRGETILRAALAVLREVGFSHGIAMTLGNLGETLLAQGQVDDAAEIIGEALARRYALRDRFGLPQQLEGLGRVAATRGDLERAVRLWSVADKLRRDIGTDTGQSYRAENQRFVNSLSGRLGNKRFMEFWAVGQLITLDDAVADALQEVGKTLNDFPFLACG